MARRTLAQSLALLCAFGLGAFMSAPRQGEAQAQPIGHGKCVGISAVVREAGNRDFPPYRIYRAWEDGTVEAIDNWTNYIGHGLERDKSANWLVLGK